MSGQTCPECGRPRAAGERSSAAGTARCDCAERTAEAIRETRSGELAEAEAFSPLRIRPYVTLAGEAENAQDSATGSAAGTAADTAGPSHRQTYGGPLPDAATAPLPRVPAEGAGAAAPGTATTGQARGSAADPGDVTSGPPGRGKRRTVVAVTAGLVLAAGALVAVTAVGGSPPDEAPATASEATAPPGDRSPAAGASAGGSGSDAPGSAQEGRASTSPSASASASAPSSASSSSASSGTGPSDGPSSTPGDTASLPAPPPGAPSASATPQSSQPAPPAPPAGPAVLRRGDEGPEVEELQRRLQLVHLYPGKTNGRFDSRLEQTLTAYQWTRGATDDRGVYGPDTRTKLEGETSQLQ